MNNIDLVCVVSPSGLPFFLLIFLLMAEREDHKETQKLETLPSTTTTEQ